MADKIDIWSNTKLDYIKSEHEYDIYKVVATRKGDQWGHGYGETIAPLTLYVDSKTGIITIDVALYESTRKEPDYG